ncbi:MAG: hypothetical protein MJH10_06870 [Epibacterium sp.]|jgi:hypothetical protein|nr:hypothetical protein [Epibacterium sp.]NQX73266.1 hypothetical protein [Epibacterium sp.]
MTINELMLRAAALEENIRAADPTQRLELLPEFSGLLAGIRNAGGAIPGHLGGLEHVLKEELMESRFDNMPV